MEPDAAEYFQGHPGRECGDHRTVGGHRAWCYDCGEWCYPQIPCVRCEVPRLRAEIATLRAGLASPSEERLAQLEAVTEAATKVVSHDEGEGQCEDRDGNRYDQPSVCADGEFCREADRRYEALRTAVLAALRTTKEGKGA